jgi:hypothetical protein
MRLPRGVALLIADFIGTCHCIQGNWLQLKGPYYRGESIWEAIIAELLSNGMVKADKVCN